MNKPKLIQISTGIYSYDKDYKQEFSHCIYGLDEDFEVWKFIPTLKEWIRLEDLEKDMNLNHYLSNT